MMHHSVLYIVAVKQVVVSAAEPGCLRSHLCMKLYRNFRWIFCWPVNGTPADSDSRDPHSNTRPLAKTFEPFRDTRCVVVFVAVLFYPR